MNYLFIIKSNLNMFLLSILLIGILNFIGMVFIKTEFLFGVLFLVLGFSFFVFFTVQLFTTKFNL